MMNILLVNPTVREHHPPFNFPVGLGIIAAVMRDNGYNVTVYDQNALRVSNEICLKEIKGKGKFDVVGIGGLITTYKPLKQLIPGLREIFPDAAIVLGGGVTIDPAVIFKNMPIDFCVHGEGEITFRILCEAIGSGKKDYSDILGISYLQDGKLIQTPPIAIENDLNQFPMPAYDLFPSEIYFNNNVLKNLMKIDCGTRRCATLVWSRGCPNQCTFCWRMMGRTLRFRSIDLVMEEISYLRSKYDIDSYLFLDECINASTKKALEFSAKLVSRGFSAPWYSHARVTNFTPEIALSFSRSGCVGLNFGIESGSQKMLDKMKKKATPEKASKAVQIARKFKIRPVCTFIIGIPDETRDTVKESVYWIIQNHIQQYVFFFATPYPGCDLYYDPLVQDRIQKKFGSRDNFFESLGDVRDLCVNMTDFSDNELIGLRKWANRKLFPFRLLNLIRQPNRWGTVIKTVVKKFWQSAE